MSYQPSAIRMIERPFVVLEEVTPETRPTLEALFVFYFNEMAAWDPGIVVSEHGMPVWHDFANKPGFVPPRTLAEAAKANWWIRDECAAYLIRCNGTVAGFTFVLSGHSILPADVDHELMDFYVMPKFRRSRVGEQAAKLALDTRRGNWIVYQLEHNRAARAFWQKVIGEYTGGNFTGKGEPTQKFRN
jgi:predicted acetyltransferase